MLRSKTTTAGSARRDRQSLPYVSVFETPMGYCGFVGADGEIFQLTLGHKSADDVRLWLSRNPQFDAGDGQKAPKQAAKSTRTTAAKTSVAVATLPTPRRWLDRDWFPALRQRLQRYLGGAVDDFSDVTVGTAPATPFQQKVLDLTRGIGYGETSSYAELASRAGSPNAARAVGNIMASNRVPLIVPCHRVIASGGNLGGFSAPQGVELKQQLLDLERRGSLLKRSH